MLGLFGCERGRKISGLCSMKSRIKVIKRKIGVEESNI